MLIRKHLSEWTALSLTFSISLSYNRLMGAEQGEEIVPRTFKTERLIVYRSSSIVEVLLNALEMIENEVEAYQENGSGYSLSSFDAIELQMGNYKPLRGGCHISLPKWIIKTKSCDNSRSRRGSVDCFRRAVTRLNFPNARKPFDFSRVNFPTAFRDIDRFERDNDEFRVNVYGLEDGRTIYPLRIAKDLHCGYIIDLLLLTAGGGDRDSKFNHFVRIYEFESLVKRQLTKSEKPLLICRRCFSYFVDIKDERNKGVKITKEERLSNHYKFGCLETPALASCPQVGDNMLYFTQHKFKNRLPFVVYCDFESALTKIHTCNPSLSVPFTNRQQSHDILAYCIYVKSDVHSAGGRQDPLFNVALTYVGEDAAFRFLETLFAIAQKVEELYSLNTWVEPTPEEWEKYYLAKVCHYCHEPFNDEFKSLSKVLDHCHLSGQFLGPAHSKCNLQARVPDFLPILFHNSSFYDLKFIVRELGKFEGDIKVIPSNGETFISLSKQVNCADGKRYIWLRFLDSCRFLQSSLDSLVKTLDTSNFPILSQFYDGRKLELLKRKGCFPYEWLDSIERLKETKLPPIDEFYSSLTESGVTDADYAHAQDVWSTFQLKTMEEYMVLYLKTDTYLLSEVMEQFRSEFLNSEYQLDPVYFYTLPGFSFASMLKISNIKLELLTDIDMYSMIRSGIRGGLTQVNIRHASADAGKSAISYLDAVNLYGQSSTDKLPMTDFQWVDNPSEFPILSADEDGEYGYFAEVDIDIPDHLHETLDEYPPLPLKEIPPGSKFPKLISTLNNKRNYVIHYRLLKFVVLNLGCELRKIHRLLRFKQSAWLASFININNEKRKIADSEFKKSLFKKFNNSNFGKTIEDVTKRVIVDLVCDKKKSQKLLSSSRYLSATVISENLVAYYRKPTKCVLNKPIYAGAAILDLAKLTMLRFHYSIMKPHYGPRLSLIYTDTDSLIYSILLRANPEDRGDWRIEANEFLGDEFDFSNLPPSHPAYSLVNKGRLGKFKDEAAGRCIEEIVALRPKAYAFKIGGEEFKKAKGVGRQAVKKRLTFQDYKETLLGGKVKYLAYSSIRSYRQHLYTVLINKKALSSFDDKRVVQEDNIRTLAYGNCKLTKNDSHLDSESE